MFNDFEYSFQEYTHEDVRADLRRAVDYFRAMPYHEHAMKLFMVDYRGFDYSVTDECECFCIDEELNVEDFPEWLTIESLGLVKNKYSIQAGRCVFPVKSIDGSIIGFVGWDPYGKPKYLDSKTYGYKAKYSTLYGMEKLEEYYRSDKPVFVVEGLMCCLYLRSKGFQALATLGSNTTKYVTTILNRFGRRLVMIPDNDEAGAHYAQMCKVKLKNCSVVRPLYGKDIDGLRKYENGIYEDALIEDLKGISSPFYTTKLLIRS